MKRIIELSENDYMVLKEDGVQNHLALADTVIAHSVPYKEKTTQDEWIPANERLPEDMQRVLIWFEYYRYGDFNCMYQTYGFGYVCDGKWSPFINGETGWQDYSIIAWQPLPKPYRKERKDIESST